MHVCVQMCLSGSVCLFVPLYVRENMCVRVHVLTCVCMHMCVQTCMPGSVCLSAHLYAGENMCLRIRVHTHVRAAGSAIQDTSRSGLSWEVSVPSPWLVGDDGNFLELRAPEQPVFAGLALLIGSRKSRNLVFVRLRLLPRLWEGPRSPALSPLTPASSAHPSHTHETRMGMVLKPRPDTCVGFVPRPVGILLTPKLRDGCDQAQVQSKQARCTDGEQRPLTRTQGRLAFPVSCRERLGPAWARGEEQMAGIRAARHHNLLPRHRPPGEGSS